MTSVYFRDLKRYLYGDEPNNGKVVAALPKKLIPAWKHERRCIEALFPTATVEPTTGSDVYMADYLILLPDGSQLVVESKTDFKASTSGYIFLEVVDASLHSNGELREAHISNAVCFKYDYLVYLCPTGNGEAEALVFKVEDVWKLVKAAERMWKGKPKTGAGTYTVGWLVPVAEARLIAEKVVYIEQVEE